jgi:hypothetical protein
MLLLFQRKIHSNKKVKKHDMKKIVFIIFGLMAITGSVQAADNITAADITIQKNGSAALEIVLNSYDMNYGGFEFQLHLPQGVTASGIAKTERLASSDDGEYTLQLNKTEDGSNVYKILCYNTSRMSIAGTTGTVATITLAADETTEVGSILTANIDEVVLSTVDLDQIDAESSSFKITIGEPDDGRIHFDENSTTLPSYTAGEKGNVTMKRTIKAGIWNTIVLPFTLTKTKAEAAFGSDVQLAEFSGFSTEYTDEDDVTPDAIVMKFSTYTMTARKGMTGGNLYLIKTSKEVETIEADDATLTTDVNNVETSDEWETKGWFKGSFVKTVVPEDGLFLNDNKFWYSTGKTNIKAFRGWFELNAVLDKETDFGAKVFLDIDDEPTDIEGIETAERALKGDVFDLQGRKVASSGSKMSNLPKGIYVVNGKKVVNK